MPRFRKEKARTGQKLRKKPRLGRVTTALKPGTVLILPGRQTARIGSDGKLEMAPLQNFGGQPLLDMNDAIRARIIGSVLSECGRRQMGAGPTAAFLGVTESTLLKFFIAHPEAKEAFWIARDQGKAQIYGWQWDAAAKGVPSMLIWLGKQYLGQRDRLDLAAVDTGARMTGTKNRLIDALEKLVADRETVAAHDSRVTAERAGGGRGSPKRLN